MTTIEAETTTATLAPSNVKRLEQIRKELKNKQLTVNEIAQAISVSPSTARKDLAEMVELGEAVKDGTKYTLVKSGKEQPVKARQTTAKPAQANRTAKAVEPVEGVTNSRTEARDRDEQVIDVLTNKGPLTKAELATVLGTSETLAYISLWRLMKLDQVAATREQGSRTPQYRVVSAQD